MDFPGGSVSQESTGTAGDLCSIPGWGKSPGEGNGTLLQYFCLGNPMDREAWWATVHGIARAGHGLETKSSHNTSVKRSFQINKKTRSNSMLSIRNLL